MDTQKLDQTYIANTYARFPVTIVKGKGSLVWDDTGKEYIDLSTGIAVDIFGVADEEWMAAVTKQLGTLQHISNLYYTEPCVKLAQMLCEKTGMKKVFFGNSGAEANECAIKAAPEVVGGEKGQGLFHHHHPEKQLPWPHDHHPGRDRSGRVPPRFYPPDRGLCLCRAERSG